MGKTIRGANGNGTQDGQDGRPRQEVDLELMAECCKMFCTKEETASLLKVSNDTIERRLKELDTNWTEFFDHHSADGKMSLRRSQFKSATEENNVSMQIWLGKQYLGQKDRTDIGFDPNQPAVFKLNMGKDIKGDEDE